MKILVANLGSTSLKWRLFEFGAEGERLVHRGGFERVTNHAQAIEDCLAQIQASGAISSDRDLDAVGFKTVLAQGLSGCVKMDAEAIAAMEAFNGIAPAHNPAYVNGVRLFAQRMPDTPLVGLFETAFYQWAPEAAMRYAVPESWAEAGVRRWGFHGASHKFIAERSADLLGRSDIAERVRWLYSDPTPRSVQPEPLRVISCHLGGSSSVTGIRNGLAIGNSLGMSPQSGLPHNNRVGDLDAMAIPFVMGALNLSLDQAMQQLSRESGLKGLSGISNDIRDIETAADQGDARARRALDVFVHEVRRWIGAYIVEMNGVDALVFTAGIGENRAAIRAAICAGLDQLGIRLDAGRNVATRAEEAVISLPDSQTRVLVIPTNEELVVAREVKRWLERSAPRGSSLHSN